MAAVALSQKQVRLLLDYDPSTGIFVWRHRSGNRSASWNARFAGRQTAIGDHRRYRYVTLFQRYYLAHRIAWLWMTGEWPAAEIDHANGDKTDNRWANLRLATRSQNRANIGAFKNKKLAVKGVLCRPCGTYQAQIQKDGKYHYLGTFPTAEDAHEAYMKAATSLYGAFALGSHRKEG